MVNDDATCLAAINRSSRSITMGTD